MKKITLFVILSAIAGIISLLLSSDPFSWYPNSPLPNIFEAFNLSITTGNWRSPYHTIINLSAYILWLTAGLLYFFSKEKETRLMRFFLAILIFSKIMVILTASLLFLSYSNFKITSILLFLLYRVIDSAWIYVSIELIKSLNKKKQLALTTATYGDAISNLPIKASSSERIFHLFVDAIMTFLLFSGLVNILLNVSFFTRSLNSIAQHIGAYTLMFLLILLFRISYYIFFEVFFQASPAKFLTETRVIRENNEPITFKSSLKRTVSRFVPFEPLSFVFSHTGWHDKWSDTNVLKEAKTGIKGSYYFLILPLSILFYFGGAYALHAYDSYTTNKILIQRFQQNITELDHKIQTLTTNDIIELQQIDQEFNLFYLKPEKIEGNRVTFAIISLNNSYEYHPDQETIEDFYYRHEWPQITLEKKELEKGIARTFNDHASLYKPLGKFKDGEGFTVENIAGHYSINSIEPYFQPNLKIKEFRQDGPKGIYLGLISKGWQGQITSVKNIDKEIQWNGQFPLSLGRKQETALTGTSKYYSAQFTIQVTVQDSLGRIQVYQIKNKNDDTECIKIK